jgi:hypothetical protein
MNIQSGLRVSEVQVDLVTLSIYERMDNRSTFITLEPGHLTRLPYGTLNDAPANKSADCWFSSTVMAQHVPVFSLTFVSLTGEHGPIYVVLTLPI